MATVVKAHGDEDIRSLVMRDLKTSNERKYRRRSQGEAV